MSIDFNVFNMYFGNNTKACLQAMYPLPILQYIHIPICIYVFVPRLKAQE